MSKPLVDDAIIVDDDKEVIEVLKMYCENLGCFRYIITAKDGIEASMKLSNQKFALILLDINMPKKTGVDILKELDKNSNNSVDSIVIVSGELNKNVISTAMSKGVKNYLVKPFDEDAFQTKIRQVLAKVRPGLLP
ncbi:MAG: hypothetical protein COW00_00760 [Bdellovibrio sp. CG12_big_fil_rev_8_21_14_0_65_39_13]|nr:MAG: hypothetical protein COW78_04695 [Bdellovibrio sp. CG22_combo_CG10-13_8_21_14_all_39_27]PIQ63013.1 MAG: hypothetical protein COW00_00760 [Bdellovibrio sp. CG12_big_fil_rev_8_21_14_0_65_39_13]PIR32688.1 MAG: hypothetical protein COV37_19245 [Bdellovibrio sp. CG11_big_fil_rev_8_21_14_0_20_39_38]